MTIERLHLARPLWKLLVSHWLQEMIRKRHHVIKFPNDLAQIFYILDLCIEENLECHIASFNVLCIWIHSWFGFLRSNVVVYTSGIILSDGKCDYDQWSMKTQSQGKYQSKYRKSKKGSKNSEHPKRQNKLVNSTEQFLKIWNRDWAHQTRNTTSDHEESSQELRMLVQCHN